ncbi:hypothetical protein L6452_06618 [Arctium lappa]|uniref:Uncharacterized protein n=1 Tax=Arctium lappa TaxID=4217 RepID=A0ACB9EJR6_ARCLA|nr:hypothetical protein L6452_06618 [Arctium lappa]
MIKTKVCGKLLTVTEEVICISLRLDDASGITSISNDELFSTLTRMGYGGPLGVFKFSKAKFSPQWRFFVHTLMHCISKKTTGWSEFSSTIAYALVCLSTARKYNFSKMIFSDLVSNLGSKKRFYMYPRFVQEVITHELTDMPHFDGVYVPKPPKGKVFSNMRRSVGDSEGVDTPLFSTMMMVSHTDEGVSPNPKEVLTEERVEYMGAQAATTSASTEKDSGNITKTSPMATLNEQSFKGPRCQETTGVDSASARQKTSTTERSHDPSIGGNTPGEGEDRYNYYELMETMGNINQDVIKQGKEIEEMKLVVLSQQVQIAKLKKMVTRLFQNKRRKQFVLKKRNNAQDASNKGEKQERETEKASSAEKRSEVEGETEDVIEAETEVAQVAETVNAAETAETVNATETKEAAVTGLSVEELEIAETLVKAKNDTPKASQKAKGVVINEGGGSKKRKETSQATLKGKGKEKLVETELPSKKKTQIEMDEEMAKQLQEQMEKEEQIQTETDRELAKIMARKLNAEYQKSLKEAAEAKKLPKEITKLQGDSVQREEVERRMKERHDLNIQRPFPEETTPSKEKAEEMKEEPESVGVEAKSGKRVKTIASKRQSKRPRIEETA